MEILNVCLLDSNGDPSKVFIFSGNNKPNPNEIFSTVDFIEFQKHNVEFIHIEQLIFQDDNIKNIKRKILEIFNYEISYPEIYLFSKTVSEHSSEDIFNNICKSNINDLITFDQFNQFNKNILNNSSSSLSKNDYYSISDFLDLNLPNQLEYYRPIGMLFTDYYDFLFSANPFLINNTNVFSNTSNNRLITLDNSLLLDYNLQNNIIYLSSASDILNFVSTSNINSESIINNYFPILAKENIFNLDSLISNKKKLMDSEKNKIKKASKKYSEKINLFYDIYENNDKDLEYIDNGINNVDITLLMFNSYKLPLNSIFKILHSSKNIPFIKFNPGKKKEKIFRIYSFLKTKNGKKIPYLGRVKILNLAKNLAKQIKQISFFIHLDFDYKVFEITCDLLENGNFNINIQCNQYFDVKLLDQIIYKSINPIIKNINEFLSTFGFELTFFQKLNPTNSIIKNIDYYKSIYLQKKINYEKNNNLFNCIFDVVSKNNNVIQLNYKRVSNFKKMDQINKIIHESFKNENDNNSVITILKENYDIPEDEAVKHLENFLNNFSRINGQFTNKVDTLIENPGFEATLQSVQFEDKLKLIIKDIDNLKYIEHLDIYIDTMFRLLQYPNSIKINKSTLNSILNKTINEDDLDDKPIVLIPEQIQPIKFNKKIVLGEDNNVNNHFALHHENKDSDEEDSDDELFFEDNDMDNDNNSDNDDDDDGLFFDDDDMEDEVMKGGEKIQELDGMPLKKPNLFFDRLISRDPALFLTKNDGKYSSYSRLCQKNVGKQPVILTKEEKDKIDNTNPNSYTHSFEYGSDPNNKYHYICPRFWCLKTDSSISEEDVKAGKCGKIIPKNADSVPKGHYVIEFHKKRTETDKDGKEVEVFNSPGFLKKDKHPDGLCIPCCFQDWNSKEQITRRNQCIKGEKEVIKKNNKVNYETGYIISHETFPLPKNRFGFLPPSLENFLGENYTNKINPENIHLLQKDKFSLLRYGTEQSDNQSFFGIIAEIYKSINGEKVLLNIKEMKNKLIKSINIDVFVRLQNGSLINTFKTKNKYLDIDINNYANSKLFKKIDANDETQKTFFKNVVRAYLNFLDYLKDDSISIDHTYLWDIITIKDTEIFDNGINLILFESNFSDITDNIELICPTNSYSSNFFDPLKPTSIVIKNDKYYEMIVALRISSSDKDNNNLKTIFYKDELPEYNDVIFNLIGKLLNHKCKPIENSRTFKFKKNISAIEIYDMLINMNYEIKSQVINFHGKCVGLLVNKDEKNNVYIPTYPSRIFKNIEISMMDDINIYSDYAFTKNSLLNIHNRSKNKIFCKPMQKIIENNLIIGIITETNQFIQVNPPSEDIFNDELEKVNESNYVAINKTISENKGEDQERLEIYNKINLESKFYNSFRNTVKILLNNKLNRSFKNKLIDRINNKSILFQDKLKDVESFLKYFVSDSISFIDYDKEVLNEMKTISNCFSNQKEKSYCLLKNDNYQLLLPKNHLFTNYDNSEIYYTRLSDEIIRHKHIQDYMLNPNIIINNEDNDYIINNDELIIIQSILNNEYFDDLDNNNTLDRNNYVENMTYDMANPENIDNLNILKSNIDDDTQEQFMGDPNLEFTTKLISLDCIKRVNNIEENEEGWNKFFTGSREIFIKPIEICTFNLLRLIIYFKFGLKFNINEIKKFILSIYTQQFKSNNKSKIISILRSQGKHEMMDKIEKNTINLENLIFSEDYYITDLDILACCEGIKAINKPNKNYVLKIVLYSDNNFKTINSNINWICLDKPETKFSENKYFFIKVPSEILVNKPMSYSLIENSFSFFDNEYIDTSDNMKKHIEKNIYTFDSLLNSYVLK